jgi:hypothetical protein
MVLRSSLVRVDVGVGVRDLLDFLGAVEVRVVIGINLLGCFDGVSI